MKNKEKKLWILFALVVIVSFSWLRRFFKRDQSDCRDSAVWLPKLSGLAADT